MVRVSRSTVIDAPIEAVWSVLRDFNDHDRWHPAVARSRIDDGKKPDQIGSVRNFVLASGERIREQLLSLSDKNHAFRYTIVESDIPLMDYVAEVSLKPVTDGQRTFWSWKSSFRTPLGQEEELANLVAEGVYEAGFAAVRAEVEGALKTGKAFAQGTIAADTVVGGTITGETMTGTAMVIDRYGGPEELHQTTVSVPPPERGQVRLRQQAIGVNFVDVYCRSGLFNLLTPPGAPGMEAAGVVIEVGPGVTHLKPGQRVAYACPPVGAYTDLRTMDANLLVALPDDVDLETAAACLLKGMTAEFLLHRVHAVKRGETILVYAPAGGVGRLLCQWGRHMGATVIGATSSEEKARVARAAGAQHVILPGPKNLGEQVMDLTRGRGADVIFDAVGNDSFQYSIAALATCGHLVSFGQASGDIGARDISSLAAKSITLSRPNFAHYTDTPEKVQNITLHLFEAIRHRVITIDITQRYDLKDAAEAHRALQDRETTGSIILRASDA
ncbi:MAG: SRPBCC family protein [Pseudomonadota bacterium]